MNSAAYVDQQIAEIKMNGKPLSDQAWEAALLCTGWPYIFGSRGDYCTSSKRKSVYNGHPDQKGLIDKCQILKSGASSCSGCKWYPGGKRVRSFDCRGFTYWILLQFGIKIMGAGATSQWNDDSNWEEKGSIDTVPEDRLVCLFYREKNDPSKMAHTGFGYRGETIECGNGVVYSKTRNKKWTYWAVPKGITGDGSLPVLRKGSKGSYVTLLQTLLLNRGYKLPKYGADGDFGNETLEAVKQFQRDWGLPEDGVVNDAVWGMLQSSPERIKLYTVTLPGLTEKQADEILKLYPGTKTPEA